MPRAFGSAQTRATAGRGDGARAASHSGGLGSLAERIDVGPDRLRGGFPRALSQIGPGSATWAIVAVKEGPTV